MRRRRSMSVFFAAVGAGLIAVTAAGAVCHPDPPGTRTLEVSGIVTGYGLSGADVTVTVRDGASCVRSSTWRPQSEGPQAFDNTRAGCAGRVPSLGAWVVIGARPASPLRAADGPRRAVLAASGVLTVYDGDRQIAQARRRASAPALAVAVSGDRVVVVTADSYSPDRPSRLEVYSGRTGRPLHDWPLLARPSTLDLHDDLALFTARNAGGVFALRLGDGKTTLFGPVRSGDTPQINEHGVVFSSNLYKKLTSQSRTFLKFLPMPVVRRAFERTFDDLHVRRPIKGFSMDGARVGLVLDEPGKTCDQVRFWNVPWHSLVRINMEHDITCTENMAIGSELAMAGIAVEWIATKAGTSRVIVSDGDKCIEHKAGVLRSATVPLAGDGLLVAYGGLRRSTSAGGTAETELMNWKTHTHVDLQSTSPARALSVDQHRIALLWEDGGTDLFTADGTHVATLGTDAPRAIALRGDYLVAITSAGALEVWNVADGAREHVWQLPAGLNPTELDLHYGIAVFSARRTVYALRIDTGAVTALARSPRRARVQIEAPGVVYQYSAATRGVVRFVPLAAVERALGLR